MRSKIFTGSVIAALGFLLVTNPVVTNAAATITGKDVKNGSLTGKDVKNSSLKGKDLKDGSVADADLGPLSLSGSENLVRVASASKVALAVSGTTSPTDALTVNITAPAAGYLVIWGSSDAFNPTDSVSEACHLTVDGSALNASFRSISFGGNENINEEENCSTDSTVPVTAGPHTVALRVDPSSTNSVYDEATLQAIFVPFGGTGLPPTAKQVARGATR